MITIPDILASLRNRTGSAATLALVLLLFPATTPATSFHTITVDGTNDFASDEDVAGTSGSTWYFTWDAANFYFGVNASDVSSGSSTRWVHLYLDTSPQPTPTSGAGSTSGLLYNTQQPALPFTADYHFRWKADNTYNNLQSWNGSAWVDAGATFGGAGDAQVFQSGTFLEGRISRSFLGNPTSLYVSGSMINEQSFGEYTYFMTPSSNSDAYDTNYTNYFGFALGSGISPDSSGNLDATLPVSLTTFVVE